MGLVLMTKPYLVARELDTSVRVVTIAQRDRGKRNYADLEGKIMVNTPFWVSVRIVLVVSLRNRTVERRGRQNDWVWQTWRGYYLRVLSGIHLTLLFLALLQKDLFKGMWSLAEGFFNENYCHACHTRFSAVFPLPSCCVSSIEGRRTATATKTHKVRSLSLFNLHRHNSTQLLCQKLTRRIILELNS